MGLPERKKSPGRADRALLAGRWLRPRERLLPNRSVCN